MIFELSRVAVLQYRICIDFILIVDYVLNKRKSIDQYCELSRHNNQHKIVFVARLRCKKLAAQIES